MLNIYTVCFFGHREIEKPSDIENCLDGLLHDLITQKEYVEFLIGREGEFDLLASAAIKRAISKYGCGNTHFTLVLPYLKAEYRDNEQNYLDYYDDVEICENAAAAHFKSAMYYVTNNSGVDLIFQSFETGEISAVHNFSSESCSLDLVNTLRKKYKINSGITVKESYKGTLFSSYCQGSTLYIGCKYEFKTSWNYYYIYVLYTYDINADKLLKTYYINDCIGSQDYYYSSLGADSTGRVFLVRRQFETETVTDETTGETSENLTSKYYVDMYDASMKYIASAAAKPHNMICRNGTADEGCPIIV